MRRAEEAARRRRTRLRWTGYGGAATVAFIVLVLFLILSQRPTSPGPATGPQPGQRAPSFAITNVDGGAFDLGALRGTVVLLDFMGSRCSACVAEMPYLVETYGTYRARNFAMVSIDVGGPLGTKDPNEARTFLQSHGGTWPIAIDNQGVAGTYDARNSIPTLIVVDGAGIVHLHHEGVLTASELAAAIGPLLG